MSHESHARPESRGAERGPTLQTSENKPAPVVFLQARMPQRVKRAECDIARRRIHSHPLDLGVNAIYGSGEITTGQEPKPNDKQRRDQNDDPRRDAPNEIRDRWAV